MQRPWTLDRVLERLREGPADHGDPVFVALREMDVTSSQVAALLEAQAGWPDGTARRIGVKSIDGPLLLTDDVPADLFVEGDVAGAISVNSRITGSLFLEGAVDGGVAIHEPIGGLWTRAHIARSLLVQTEVSGSMWIGGEVGRKVSVNLGPVHGTVHIEGAFGSVDINGTVGELIVQAMPVDHLMIRGEVVGDVIVTGDMTSATVDGPVGGRLVLEGGFVGPVVVSGSVGGALAVTGTAGSEVEVREGCGGDLSLRVFADGYISVTGPIGGQLLFEGGATNGLALDDVVVADRTTLNPEVPTALTTLVAARFEAPVFVGDLLSIARCDFRRCVGIDELELVGSDLFAEVDDDGSIRSLRQVSELLGPTEEGATARERASINRQLRMNLEGRGNRPAAAIFYRGEMNARREDARRRRAWFEWAWITAYRAVSGYGTSVWRPVVAFAVVVAVATALMGRVWVPVDAGRTALSGPESLVFVLQSTVSFFRPPEADLSATEAALQLAARFVGPILLALAVVGARDKVAR